MSAGTPLTAAAALSGGHPAQATLLESTSATTTYHRMTVDGVGVFYREAGPKDAPTIVLLHGFPSSSREFDTLIPLLAPRYHLIAPDSGFCNSDAPSPSSYTYTFDNLARTTNGLLEHLKIDKYPSSFMTMAGRSDFVSFWRIRSGCGRFSSRMPMPIRKVWAPNGPVSAVLGRSESASEVFDAFVSLAATEQRHTLGTSHPERYNPDTWTDEYAHLSRPGQREIQADLLYDYRTNVASYPAWQAWLREYRPPTLVVWGGTILVYRSRRRGIQARSAGRRNPSARRRSFRVGREER